MVLVGIHWTGTLDPNQTTTWYTSGWNASQHVVWTIVPITPTEGGPQLEWDVQVQRTDVNNITYYITVKNLTPNTVDFEGRYALLNPPTMIGPPPTTLSKKIISELGTDAGPAKGF